MKLTHFLLIASIAAFALIAPPQADSAGNCTGYITFKNDYSKRLIIEKIEARFPGSSTFHRVYGSKKIDAGKTKTLQWYVALDKIGGSKNCTGKDKYFRFRYRAQAGSNKKRTATPGSKDGTFNVTRTGKTSFTYGD